jgi:hypothetical protein
VTSCFILLVALLGMFGVVGKKKRLLQLYVFLTTLTLIAECVGAAVALNYKNMAVEAQEMAKEAGYDMQVRKG